MPGKCLLCRYVRAGLGESARKAVNIARERKVPQGLTWQKEPKLSSPREREQRERERERQARARPRANP